MKAVDNPFQKFFTSFPVALLILILLVLVLGGCGASGTPAQTPKLQGNTNVTVD